MSRGMRRRRQTNVRIGASVDIYLSLRSGVCPSHRSKWRSAEGRLVQMKDSILMSVDVIGDTVGFWSSLSRWPGWHVSISLLPTETLHCHLHSICRCHGGSLVAHPARHQHDAIRDDVVRQYRLQGTVKALSEFVSLGRTASGQLVLSSRVAV